MQFKDILFKTGLLAVLLFSCSQLEAMEKEEAPTEKTFEEFEAEQKQARKSAVEARKIRGQKGLIKAYKQRLKTPSQRDFNRMIILIDDQRDEGPDKSPAVAEALGLALQQQACSVLVTYTVINNFLTRAYDQTFQGDRTTFQKFGNNFDPRDFTIYYLKNSSFFLLVPTKFDNILKPQKITLPLVQPYSFDRAPLKGANLKSFQQEGASADQRRQNLLTLVRGKENDADVLFDVQQFASLFYCERDIRDDASIHAGLNNITDPQARIELIKNAITPWIFYIGGHGTPEPAHIVSLDPQHFQALLMFINSMNTRLVALMSCFSGGQNLDYSQFKENLFNPKISQNLHYPLAVLSSQDSPTGLARVADDILIDYDLFFKAVGTQNQNWLPNALQAITHPEEVSEETIPQVLIPGGGWFSVFLPHTKSIKHPQIQSLNMVTVLKHHLGKKSFLCRGAQALLLYSTQIPITLEIEHNVIPATLPTATVYMVYYEHARATHKPFPCLGDLFMGKYQPFFYPAILSMQRGNAAHTIKKIILPSAAADGSGILAFVRDAFLNMFAGTKIRLSKKAFFIQELVGRNDLSAILSQLRVVQKQPAQGELEQALGDTADQIITLHNVGVATYFDEASRQTSIRLLFEYQQSYWAFTFNGMPEHTTEAVWDFKKIEEKEFTQQRNKMLQSIGLAQKQAPIIRAVSNQLNTWASGHIPTPQDLIKVGKNLALLGRQTAIKFGGMIEEKLSEDQRRVLLECIFDLPEWKSNEANDLPPHIRALGNLGEMAGFFAMQNASSEWKTLHAQDIQKIHDAHMIQW